MTKTPKTTKTLTAAEEATIRIAHRALLEALARAKARGLSPEEIAREEEDEDSQLWEDVAEIGRALRARRLH